MVPSAHGTATSLGTSHDGDTFAERSRKTRSGQSQVGAFLFLHLPRAVNISDLAREVRRLRRLCRGLAQGKVCLARVANVGPGCQRCAAMEEKARMLGWAEIWQRDEDDVASSELVDGSPPVGGAGGEAP